jgi:hypothetical protein
MANIIPYTTDFEAAEYTPLSNVIALTRHAAPPPSGLGVGVDDATKIEDASAGSQASLSTDFHDVPANSTIVGSWFVRKDAVTDRWPAFAIALSGGTPRATETTVDTSAGTIGDNSADAAGVVDYDASWWRFWFRVIDSGSNTLARIAAAPSKRDALNGGSNSSALLGSFIGHGVNITVGPTLLPYETQPRRFLLVR